MSRVSIWRRKEEGRRYIDWTLYISGLGTLAKGWATWLDKRIRHFEIEFALGGEDNMAQVGLALPYLARCYVGLRVPRWATKGWIYHRREWTLRIGYVGRWVELLIASDEHMRDTGMDSYYREKRKGDPDCGNCNHYAAFHTDPVLVPPHSVKSLDDVDKLTKRIENPNRRCVTYAEINHGSTPCDCPGYVPAKSPWTRLALWPGIHINLTGHPRDRLLGRTVCTVEKGDPEPVIIPMPEGNYPGLLREEKRVWKRPRWPWVSRVRTDYWIEMQIGVPTPGKGENSYDCEDDGIYGASGSTRHGAIAHVVDAALRQRELYGSANWTPDAGWPEVVGR